MESFSKQLKEARKRKNLTQEELSKRLGISRTTVTRWEKGDILPDYANVRRLSDILEFDFLAVSVNGCEKEGEKKPESAGKKGRKAVLPAVCALVLLMTLGLCLSRSFFKKDPPDMPAPEKEPEKYSLAWFQKPLPNDKKAAYVEIVPEKNPIAPVYGFANGNGWKYAFRIREINGIDFHLEEMLVSVLYHDKLYSLDFYDGERFAGEYGSAIIGRGAIHNYVGGIPVQEADAITILIRGHDEKQNVQEFHGYAEFSSENSEK